MKKMLNKAAVKAYAKLQAWKADEQGMEIIQVLVLLAIGLGLVALFIGFGDKITAAVTQKVNDFLKDF